MRSCPLVEDALDGGARPGRGHPIVVTERGGGRGEDRVDVERDDVGWQCASSPWATACRTSPASTGSHASCCAVLSAALREHPENPTAAVWLAEAPLRVQRDMVGRDGAAPRRP